MRAVQTGLFEPLPPPLAAPAPVASWMAQAEDEDGLRWYQRDAVNAVHEAFQTYRSCMIVMATGLGKTQTFGAIAAHWPGKVLVLAHRDELIEQARGRLAAMCGEYVEVEQAQLSASSRARIVVATVQTLQRKRLKRFAADHFGLVIIDETHHALAQSYRNIIEHFSAAKLLGVTATPDRGDKLAMGLIFESAPFRFDISEGIEQGYLVPIRGQTVQLKEINLDKVKLQAGDFSAAGLDEAMVGSILAIVDRTLALVPDRQGICFFPGVRTAELACEMFNKQGGPDTACFIHGGTDPDERKQIVKDYRAGRYRFLCNCAVATEGFDAPKASAVIMARPTKSRAFYTQCIGRGTRVLPGIVEDNDGKLYAAERRAAIAASGKKDLLILDFVGVSSKHSLVSPHDLLGGRYTEAEVKRAKKKAERDPGGDVAEQLEQARAELRKLAQKASAKVQSTVSDFDPFSVVDVEHDGSLDPSMRVPPTPEQLEAVGKIGLTPAEAAKLSSHEAVRFIQDARKRRAAGLASYKQCKLLSKYGVMTTAKLTFDRAGAAINYIKQKDWGRNRLNPVDPKLLDRILHHVRQPGEEG